MKMSILGLLVVAGLTGNATAQDLNKKDVPAIVKEAFVKKYPSQSKVSWEKEKGNYEANWGGKSGEDNSATFTPSGDFVEIVIALKVSDLPAPVFTYVKERYQGAKIKEAGKVTDAAGHKMFEAEVKGKDLIFDESGNFLKKD